LLVHKYFMIITRKQIIEVLTSRTSNGMVAVKTQKDVYNGLFYPKATVCEIFFETAVEWIYYGLALLADPDFYNPGDDHPNPYGDLTWTFSDFCEA